MDLLPTDGSVFNYPFGIASSYPGKPRSLFWSDGSEESVDTSGTLMVVNPSTNGLFRNPFPPDAFADPGTTFPDTLDSCAIAVDTPANRYCCTAHGLYRTSDSGQRWSPTTSTTPCDGAYVDPSSSSVVYVTSRSSLRRTDDGGASFVDITPPIGTCDGGPCFLAVDDVLLDSTDPAHLFAHLMRLDCFFGVYYESFDRGGTWRQLAGDFDGRKLYLDPRDSRVLYAAGLGGVRKSRDGGSSWFDVNTGLDLYAVCDLGVSRQHAGVVYAAVCSQPPRCSKPPTRDDVGSSEGHGLYWTATGGE